MFLREHAPTETSHKVPPGKFISMGTEAAMSRKTTPLTVAAGALRPALGAALIMSIFTNLTMFVIPLYSMQVYDRVLSSRNPGTLFMLTLIAALFLALYGLLEYTRNGVLVRAGVRFSDVLSTPLLDAAFRARLAGLETHAGQAIRDADTLREGISSGIVTSLFDIPWSLVFIALCYLLHPLLGQVALSGAVLIFCCALVTEFSTRSSLEAVTQHAAEKHRFAQSSLRNAETIRGLGMGQAVRQRWQDFEGSVIAAQSKSSERSAALVGISKTVRMGVQIALLATGAWLAIGRDVSPGAMVAAMIIMGRALAPVEQAVGNWKRLAACRSAWHRLYALLMEFPERQAGTALPNPRGTLSVEELYLIPTSGGAPVVKNVNFAIEAGTILAVIGPSGGGKSSLIRALAGVWAPAKGAVRLDAAELSQWDPDEIGKLIGYLPQEVEFLPATVAENIARLGTPDDEEVVRAAKVAGVHETILKLPKGYETPIGDGGVVLSGGQRQRLALARALYGRPCLVILDEPNSNLDGEGEAALARALQTMKANGQTVVIVTHKPQAMRYVDKVMVLVNGMKTEFGDRDEIMSKVSGAKVTNMPLRKANRHDAVTERAQAEGEQPFPAKSDENSSAARVA
jgi:PrtD family type I secretion system ABC transporter